METVKSMFWKPDPQAQARKCNALLRQNARTLDRDINKMKQLENKTRTAIVSSSKRAQRSTASASAKNQANSEMRIFARELMRMRRQTARLTASKAQLQSVQMQVSEAFAMRRIEGSLKASTSIMRDVNSLVKMPELTGTMRELSQELMKAGIIEEMVGDMLPDDNLEEEDEEAEAEVDKVLGEVLKTPSLPEQKLPTEVEEPAEAVDEDSEATLAQMRGRLEALRS